jgi:hypothetical protein
MVAAIKQIVTVGAEGRIEIPRSALAPGTRVEVNVVPQPAEKTEQSDRDSFLENLDKLQKMMNLDRASAEKWMDENRELRKGIGKHLDSSGH